MRELRLICSVILESFGSDLVGIEVMMKEDVFKAIELGSLLSMTVCTVESGDAHCFALLALTVL
jgi:hypothetical protein